MENSVEHTVIIIGGGPSGLALGYWLQKSNIETLIIEKAFDVGSSWRQMPDQLRLISFWATNTLIPEDVKLFPRSMTHRAPEFADYLKNFQATHKLKINFNECVKEFSKTNGSFNVVTDKQSYKGQFVVDCRGYFSYPFTPEYKITGTPPLMVHFKDYKNAAQFGHLKNILVVGKRLSAGQVLLELKNAGKFQLFLSAKSEIKFSAHPIVYNFFLGHLDAIEKFIKKFKLRLKQEIEVPMHSNAKELIKNDVLVLSDISHIENKMVHFKDGATQEMDAIIFTTGFKPPPVNFKNDFESSETEGLFYLGRGSQRSFTSRFIRGIRDDAPILAKLISGRTAFKNNRQ